MNVPYRLCHKGKHEIRLQEQVVYIDGRAWCERCVQQRIADLEGDRNVADQMLTACSVLAENAMKTPFVDHELIEGRHLAYCSEYAAVRKVVLAYLALAAENERLRDELTAILSVGKQLKHHNEAYRNEVSALDKEISMLRNSLLEARLAAGQLHFGHDTGRGRGARQFTDPQDREPPIKPEVTWFQIDVVPDGPNRES